MTAPTTSLAHALKWLNRQQLKKEIMAHAKYIPTSDSEKGVWLTNFTSKLSVYATTLGVTPSELSSVQNDQAMFKYIINLMEQYYHTYLSLAGYKNMLKFAQDFQHLGALPTLPTGRCASVMYLVAKVLKSFRPAFKNRRLRL